ncbi:MAG TPA: phospholipase D-like domain-containing protein [Kofleriaceae bacterium]|nr:phospholipase D-like domain-containing protein [Kofleriaceae bacterium]
MVLVAALGGCATDGGAGRPDGDGAHGGKADDEMEVTPDGAPWTCPYAGASPARQVFFTRPRSGGDFTIEDEIVRLAQAAEPGSRLRLAYYHLAHASIAEALVAAHRRGVDVGVVVDEKNQTEDPPGSGTWRLNDEVALLRAELGEDRMIVCGGGDLPADGGACMGTTINHNKLILASALCDGSRDVVVQSSANFGDSQLILHNNMVVLRDDEALFAAYETYWNDLATDRQDLGYYREADGDAGTHVWFFPRAAGLLTGGIDPDSDTVIDLLADVDCASGAEVLFAESIWNEGRIYIVDRLRAMADEGCDVRVLFNQATTEPEVKAALLGAFPGPELTPVKHMHHKYILVDGVVAGAPRQLVWTGSHNLTFGALRRNDETLLRVDDPAIFAAFRADWQAIHDRWADDAPPP